MIIHIPIIKKLTFGEDAFQNDYEIDVNRDFGHQYDLIAEEEEWLKIYNDEGILFQAKGRKIKISKKEEIGFVIQIK